ncbi:hypothetical protein [Sphingomonas sp. TDK1]|uniref:hypothetical protein n=1 Tax=Sphingomonas sp. TDK1 TaxID=453247 RepID=UPI0009FFA36A
MQPFQIGRAIAVAHLMREMGLAGVIRSEPLRSTRSDKATPGPPERRNRHFRAPTPTMLRESDFT